MGQPQYPPMPYPNGQPSYIYGPQYGTPPAPPQPQPPAQPTFVSPGAPGAGGQSPKVYELDGCLVAFSPTQFTAAGTGDNLTGYGKDGPRDRVTTNIFLLETPNGQPLYFGRTEPHTQPTHVVQAPARFSGAWVSSQNIVKALAPGGQPLVGAMVLGRIQRSDVGQRPWNLVAVDGTPDMDRAIQLWSALSMGAAHYNEPQPLGPPQVPVPANSVQYGGYAPTPVPPQPTAWTGQPMPPQPQYAPPPPAPTAPQILASMANNGAPQPAIAGHWPTAPGGAFDVNPTPPVPQPPAPPQAPGLPQHLLAAGWTDATWAQLTTEQQSQVLASTPMR